MALKTPSKRDVLILSAATASMLGLRLNARAATSSRIAFGFQNTSWGAVGMVAEAKKTFSRAGANVAIYKFDGGKSTRDAMVSGRVDIGILGSTPFIVGAAKGDMIAIGMAQYAGKTDSIVAGVKTKITSVGQLKGRKVASQVGSATDYVFQNKILPAYGLSKSDVDVVNIPHENHIAALASGSVDAFAGVEPFPSVAQVNGIGVVLVDYSKFDLLPVILAANRSAVQKNPDAVVAFLRGWLAAVRFFTNQPDETTDVIWNYFKNEGFSIDRKVISLMLSKLDVNPDYTPELSKYLAEQSDILLKQRQIDSAPDWSKLLDRTYLKRAMST